MMKLILEFVFLACVSSASLLPLDPTSAVSWRDRAGNQFAFGAHEAHALPIPGHIHSDHVGVLAAKSPPEIINPVNFVSSMAAGYVRPVPYSFGAHAPVVHDPHLGLHEGGQVPYSGYRYPVIGIPQNFRMH